MSTWTWKPMLLLTLSLGEMFPMRLRTMLTSWSPCPPMSGGETNSNLLQSGCVVEQTMDPSGTIFQLVEVCLDAL